MAHWLLNNPKTVSFAIETVILPKSKPGPVRVDRRPAQIFAVLETFK